MISDELHDDIGRFADHMDKLLFLQLFLQKTIFPLLLGTSLLLHLLHLLLFNAFIHIVTDNFTNLYLQFFDDEDQTILMQDLELAFHQTFRKRL